MWLFLMCTAHSPVCYSDADNTRNTWRYPDNSQLLHTTDQDLAHRLRETSACTRSYYTACTRPQKRSEACRSLRIYNTTETNFFLMLTNAIRINVDSIKYLVESLSGDQLELNRFHSGDISETHLRNVQCTNHVGPAWIVRTLEGAILTRAKLTLLSDENKNEIQTTAKQHFF